MNPHAREELNSQAEKGIDSSYFPHLGNKWVKSSLVMSMVPALEEEKNNLPSTSNSITL